METSLVRNKIQKIKVKDLEMQAVYEEFFPEDNYSNTIDKKCSQVIHPDLKKALDGLRVHLAVICEMPESDEIISKGIFNVEESLISNYVVTGYSHGGSEESEGVTLIGKKLLKTGKVLNLISPFVQFSDEESYQFAGTLYADILSCDNEALEYLFSEKYGVKQMSLDFETDVPQEDTTVTLTDDDMKAVSKEGRRKRTKKASSKVVAFDTTL